MDTTGRAVEENSKQRPKATVPPSDNCKYCLSSLSQLQGIGLTTPTGRSMAFWASSLEVLGGLGTDASVLTTVCMALSFDTHFWGAT